jgi:hypothetical protein
LPHFAQIPIDALMCGDSGSGYFDEYITLNSTEDFKNIVKSSNYFPDVDDLEKGWLKKNDGVKMIRL